MFVHRINWPRTWCITYRKKVIVDRGQVFQRRKNMHSQTHEKKEKCVFFLSGLIKIANLSCKEMLRSYRGSLRTEIAFWLLFISCYENLQPSRYHLQVSKFQHQPISSTNASGNSQNFHDFLIILSSSGSSLMRKVELSNKPSVKSLQGNKNIILVPRLFLFQTALNHTANSF